MAVAPKVVLYPPEIQKLLRSPAGPVARATIVLAEKVKQEAIRIAPRRTGNLRNHIVKRIEGGPEGTRVLVGVEGVPYAIWVHEGANPHLILPKRGPYLVFTGRDGSLVFARRVNHPGNKPNQFLLRAAANVGHGGTLI